jgi:hypothetical protein
MPRNELECIDCWVHELSELSVRCVFIKWGEEEEIQPFAKRKTYEIVVRLPNGKFQKHILEHILTSLVYKSIIKLSESDSYYVYPEKYEKMVARGRGIPLITIDEY